MESTAIITRQPSWSNIGKDVRSCTNMEQVLQASGLDYKVVMRPVYWGGEYDDVGTQELVGRHVQNAPQKLEEAREVLKVSANYMQQLSLMAESYATKKLSPTALDRVMDWMFPIENRETMNHYSLFRLEEARTRFAAAYNADDNGNFRGTAWGLINAYTDFLTHAPAMGKTATRFEGKFVKTTFGQPMNRILTIVDQIAA